MQTQWIDLHDIPANGREFSFHDQTVWDELWIEFGMECRSETAVTVDFTILPASHGVFVKGKIHGEVIVPCTRCLEDARVPMDNAFEFFEPATTEDDGFNSALLREQDGTRELDIIALVWEQFLMALPDKPLCSPACKGLCVHCGQNLNTAQCACDEEIGDIRLSALRNMKVPTK